MLFFYIYNAEVQYGSAMRKCNAEVQYGSAIRKCNAAAIMGNSFSRPIP